MNVNHERLLTAAELAKRLGISERRVRDLARLQLIPSFLLGRGAFRFEWPEVRVALRALTLDANKRPEPVS